MYGNGEHFESLLFQQCQIGVEDRALLTLVVTVSASHLFPTCRARLLCPWPLLEQDSQSQ